MVEEADWGIVPWGFKEKYSVKDEVVEMKEESLFSESLLETCIKLEAKLK